MKIKEATIQANLIQYINQYFPDIFVYSIPNELILSHLGEKNKIIYLAKMKRIGMKKGMPDLHILHPAHGFKSFFIELKAPGKKPTAIQLSVHQELRELGHKVEYFSDLGDAAQAINDYLKSDFDAR